MKDGVVVDKSSRKKTKLLGSIGGVCQFEKKRLSKADIAEIQSDLGIWSKNEETTVPIFWETDDYLLTPRDYGIRKFGIRSFLNCMSLGSAIDVEFKKTLDPKRHQDRLASETLKVLKPGAGGCIEAGTGVGKTVLALYIAAQLKRTTVILVHSEFLADQWADRAKEYLGLTDDEIGRVQSTKCEYAGKKVVICVVQSTSLGVRSKREDYPEEFYNWAGLVVYDELHRHSSTTWHLVSAQFPAAYRLGLTATPKRADGMEPVIFAHVGPILSSAKMTMVEPKIHMVTRDQLIPKHHYCIVRGGRLTDEINMSKLINALADDPVRNAELADFIADALASDRQVMVLSDRLEQLRVLEQLVRAILKEKVESGEVPDKKWTLAQFVGGLKKEVRDEAAKADCRFSTWAFASEGIDLPALDTLVQATPRTNVEQGIGRILREWQGKARPYVIDIVDSPEICQVLANKRLMFYETQKWPVKVV